MNREHINNLNFCNVYNLNYSDFFNRIIWFGFGDLGLGDCFVSLPRDLFFSFIVLVEVEVDRRSVVKNKVVLTVRHRRDVDVCTTVVNVHYVVDDVRISICSAASSLGSWASRAGLSCCVRLVCIIICLISFHVNMVSPSSSQVF